jgi:hypothetical protein
VGATGPQGPQGTTGATGPRGATGPQGGVGGLTFIVNDPNLPGSFSQVAGQARYSKAVQIAAGTYRLTVEFGITYEDTGDSAMYATIVQGGGLSVNANFASPDLLVQSLIVIRGGTQTWRNYIRASKTGTITISAGSPTVWFVTPYILGTNGITTLPAKLSITDRMIMLTKIA